MSPRDKSARCRHCGFEIMYLNLTGKKMTKKSKQESLAAWLNDHIQEAHPDEVKR